ncbi:sensor domain-containing diguanylate cyclase [Deinococcus aerius]|uniref:Sensor domain-containing diguanylate cyclase n=1 Tax=Deinococcus aerius TaxID=200253 RepID=A0A2I9CV71_9DEIO|nr:diguanylate cyclase [Deinococcus aerius]GBF05809.1 sensor domain-containing diguanylate cyclase [Deinococcus aerius]
METIAAREQERLAALERYAVLDTLPEAAFDRLTALAARLFGVPISLISLVGSQHTFFKACFGLDLRQTDRSLSFCTHALHSLDVLVVPDLAADARFALHPFVTGAPGLRFYAGAPLVTPDGHTLGTLCILDERPRAGFSDQERAALKDFAALVIDELELRLGRQEADRAAQVRETQARTLQDALSLSQLLRGIGDLTDLDLPPGDLLPHIVELTGAALDVDWGGLVVVRGDRATSRGAWHSPAGRDLAGQATRELRREEGGLLWRVAECDVPQFVSDYAREPGAHADLVAAGVRSAASVCLGREGEATYVMTLLRLHRERPWTTRDRQLVDAVSRAVRQSLSQSAARAALRESQERLRLALEAAPVILWTADAAGTFTLVEGRGLAALGANPAELVGRSVREVFAGDPAVLANLDRALAGESFTTQVAVGGRIFEAHYAPLHDAGGRPVGLVGTGYDVTAAVQAQREAVRAREQAEALLELAHLLDGQASAQDLAGAALAAVGRALGEGTLVLWQRAGDRMRPLATHGDLPLPTWDLPVGQVEATGVLQGRAVFLTAPGLSATFPGSGLRGAALLPVAVDIPERAWVLGVYRTGPFGEWSPFERSLLAAAARTLGAGVERQRHVQGLETAARTDILTGLGNRRAFEIDLGAELSRARRLGAAVAVLSVDLDGLKRLNDTLGHARGDALLREFARALRQCLREEDRVHRLGGDEYAVVLPSVGPNEAAIILERVRIAVDRTRAAGFGEVDASAGVACFPADTQDPAELVRLSDLRMYADKAGKRALQVC